MKANDFIPASKPRNFVAKNQKTAGAGAHRDKKRDEKQGNVKHKAKQFAEGWKDEGDDFSDWSDYVKEKLTKAAPDQRLGLAKKLSQVEVKNFGSTTSSFNKQTGKAQQGLGLTDTVRSALRYFSGEQDSIRRQSDQDGAPGNFSMPFGSVDIAGMENATPAELAVMKKAVNMGPDWASAAGKIYRETGTITHKDLEDIRKDFEGNIEWNKPMYSSPEAQASRERAMSGESVNEGGVKDLMYNLRHMSDEEFSAHYNMSKDDARRKMSGVDEAVPSGNEFDQRRKLIKYIARQKGWDVSDLEHASTQELVQMYKDSQKERKDFTARRSDWWERSNQLAKEKGISKFDALGQTPHDLDRDDSQGSFKFK